MVACMQDPNPLVAGKGFERLRNAGISVASGILEDEAKALNEAFAKFIRQQNASGYAQSGDDPGRQDRATAERDAFFHCAWWRRRNRRLGDQRDSRAHVQQLRHQNDAIMVGVGTIIADDPLLTDRSGLARRQPLLRVIVDSRLRLPPQSRVVKTAKNDVLVLCSFAEEKRKRELQDQGIRVEQVQVGVGDGRPDMKGIAQRLGKHGDHQPPGGRRCHDQWRRAGFRDRRQGLSLLCA